MKKKIPLPEVQRYLEKLKKCLCFNDSKMYIAANKDKNFNFAYMYNITREYIKDVLLGLNVNDFKYALVNNNPKFEDGLLYVFGPILNLCNALGIEENIEMYIKINFREGNNQIIVVSFHETECGYGD